ncbi:hypothetical protein V5P93_000334 [Actinokineospora auranticolor]|uniref:Uncharacterized protein n=1 Tax=Actinokineospora auranticolor TaxID=155976 RepID=A0A2S6GKK9_9PSEU|nr:hypothetical protein [Actinokineospora auranticolor]PPK65778.1 hypothetical protein CLV40_11238 [Actinokineospora auranticolor]
MAGVLLATACSAAPEPDPAANSAWADRLCAIVADVDVVLVQAPPSIDPGDPAVVQTEFRAYLDRVVAALGSAATAIGAMGPAPFPDGDRVAHAAVDALRLLRAPLAEAGTAMAEWPDAPDRVAAALGEVAPKVAALDLAEPLAGAVGTDFTRWAERAPQCARIPALRR